MKAQIKPYQLLLKCEKVMRSCKTLEQLNTARNYCCMALKVITNKSNMPIDEKDRFWDEYRYITTIKPENIHDPSVDSKDDSQGSCSL